ncbi:hypothetical protein FG386_000676 [Cryptosporidium ryanae]|uniref:uncharacterized protein n=1 Tax=Cryptosporidium ryanae TaxID=515981 RepID=UPI00351A23EC|nr:hypothetical protein FG386_000676 [Cryptosporidium ryanae]
MVVIRKEYLGSVGNRPRKIGISDLSSNPTGGAERVIKTGLCIKKKRESVARGSSFVNVILDKKKGQHLLKNTGILDKIINAAEIKPTDTVLEIGPGTGNLTMRLLPLARRVVAFDIDPRMVAEVKKRSLGSGFSNLEAREGDALRSPLGEFDVCTANLPYQISSPFVFRLLSLGASYRCAVLMFQEEFALRLLAEPGDKHYCRLTVNTKLLSKVTRVCKVAPGSFNPPPKVNSMVVKFEPAKTKIPVDFQEWDGLMRICFSRKKKTIRANFNNDTVLSTLENNYNIWSNLRGFEKTNLPFKVFVFNILEETGLSSRRGFTVDIDDYLRLLFAFNKNGVHFNNVGINQNNACLSENSGSRSNERNMDFMFEDVEMED